MMPPKSPRRHDFEISIICALPLEARAVKAIFDEPSEDINHDRENDDAQKAPLDRNMYSTGKIGYRDVVLAHMPGMGKVPAAVVTADLKRSFEGIKLALLVGICGGVPKEAPESIRLGDIIVSKQIIQYDFGRRYPNGFKRKGGTEDSLGRQNPEIRAFISKLEASKKELEQQTAKYLASLLQKPNFGEVIGTRALKDDLFPPDYWHKHRVLEDCKDQVCNNSNEVCQDAQSSSCEKLKCELDELERRSKPKQKPDIHFGSIASGDTVMKSGEDRDKLAKEENIIAFDMEGAGVWDYLPCIVVKGVCDYADSHKNKKWQEYASVAAAACAKTIVEQWSIQEKSPDVPQQVSLLISYVDVCMTKLGVGNTRCSV